MFKLSIYEICSLLFQIVTILGLFLTVFIYYKLLKETQKSTNGRILFDFHTFMLNEDFRGARKKLLDNYDKKKGDSKSIIDEEEVATRKVCAYYNFLSEMFYKGITPEFMKKDIKSSLMKCYEAADEYIKIEVKKDDYYCSHFRKLYIEFKNEKA